MRILFFFISVPPRHIHLLQQLSSNKQGLSLCQKAPGNCPFQPSKGLFAHQLRPCSCPLLYHISALRLSHFPVRFRWPSLSSLFSHERLQYSGEHLSPPGLREALKPVLLPLLSLI